jgi:hypothetical protein
MKRALPLVFRLTESALMLGNPEVRVYIGAGVRY